jgi:putative transposase
MARIGRVVADGLPHHITERGNRRQKTFFCDEDYALYIKLMAEWCTQWQVEVWAYCLMPNHVHLVAVPESGDGLCRAIGEAHRRYTRHINFREGWRGHLWQGRFASYPMDENYLLATARYVELNPVRAGLVTSAEKYPWSSASAHISGQDDVLVKVKPLIEITGDWRRFLSGDINDKTAEVIRFHERIGRPLGSGTFIDQLEMKLNRPLKKRKPGPKKADSKN